MATISELNIRLGLLTREFDRNLRKVERDLRASAGRLSQLGTDLTIAISAPLVAIGAAAIKNAGEIESLRLAMVSTFESAGRSASEAQAEVEALRKSALAPGLDFEQAVRGSIRLQGVGQSAEQARATLEAMANAIALTGGTSKELDGVTRQFAQIIAKGRVLQEDVTILAENMPRIADLMQRAFGTASVEAIRKAGVSGQEFVERITAVAQQLPKVEGGIKNALVNAAQAARISLARLGEEINKTFNVSATLDKFISVLDTLVNAFASLSDQSKKTIISVAGLLVAIGPITAIIGRLGGAMASAISFSGGLIRAYKALALTINAGLAPALLRVHALTSASIGVRVAKDFGAIGTAATAASGGVATLSKSVATMTAVTGAAKNVQFAKTALAPIAATAATATGGVTGLTGAVRIFSVAMKTAFAVGAIGLFVAAIVSAVDIFRAYNREATRTAAVQSSLSENTRLANESIAAEKVKVEQLAGVLKDNTATREQQARALKTLQAIAPDYFGKLDLEKSKVQDIDWALGRYTESLLKAAKAQAAFEQITEIEKQLNNIQDAAQPTLWQKATNAVLGYGNALNVAVLNVRSGAKNAEELRGRLVAQREALVDVIKANGGIADSINRMPDVVDKLPDTGAATKKVDLYKQALESIAAIVSKGDVLGSDIIAEQAREIENQIERLIEGGYRPYGKEVESLRAMLVKMRSDAQIGFFSPNATQTALLEIDKINAAISRVTEVEVPINVIAAGAAKSIGSIDKALRLLDAQQITVPFSAESALGGIGSVQSALDRLTAAEIEVPFSAAAALAGIGTVQDALKHLDAQQITVPFSAEAALDGVSSLQSALDRVTAVEITVPFSAAPALSEFGKIQQAAGQLTGLDIPILVSAKSALTEIVKVEQAIARATQVVQIEPLVSAPLTIAEIEKIERAGAGVDKIVFVDTDQAKAALAGIERIDAAIKQIKARTPVDLVNLPPGTGINLPQIPTIEIPTAVQPTGILAVTEAINDLRQATNNASVANDTYIGTFERIGQIMQAAQGPIGSFNEALKQSFDLAISQGSVLGAVVTTAADAMVKAAEEGASSFGQIASAAAGAAAKVVRSWIQQGVAAAVAKALSGLPFPANLAAGAIAGVAASALFNKAIKAIGIPALAEGGVAKKPTLALIGEYQGAASNPEIVAPEQKLRQIFRSEMGGGTPYILSTNISGSDLQIVLERAGVKTRRIRGF